MTELSVEQIRSFRLHSHHLDAKYQKSDMISAVGACGMQNTPPGAWETALFNRIPDISLEEMEHILYQEKTLIQAWSLRGAPVIFPASESDVFLSSLIPSGDEPWIYTQGIPLALDFLQMTFEQVYDLIMQVMPQLNDTVIVSKTSLDQTIADWILPHLPAEKRALWNSPSMYGSPDKQTAGGAAVSFLLRPCAFHGLVVFGERNGISPTFTSYQNWLGHLLKSDEESSKKLVRKYIHCYGPITVDAFITWLGCSGKQGRRLWNLISEELEPVTVSGRKNWILTADKPRLQAAPSFPRSLLLLGGHDPYLDQRDRLTLQPNKTLHPQIWKMVTNPGAIVHCGEVVGVWTSQKKRGGLNLKLTLWTEQITKSRLRDLAEEYAAFRRQELLDMEC